ncbi:DNA internalization-related competence protein ComEC/Rec2 [Photobacterium carnosum]|uniref:DNA internalization-related competence protein ComEC/Rec2 n=1 Tax=Photobacterium carnosum TaxID=2023717 RepID=UPI001E551335|nr:DNA internalization-related competence protein ComEC/Rec2 [Photobacterium carnosum]MCD9547512.1 DNA internalization-related competence protein ComEC/Rec2 [Photobacterium carnosum]MCF2304229.1 DNA internalization-related competence protein ComEC/Rec2 [Photobacterium carnosum]
MVQIFIASISGYLSLHLFNTLPPYGYLLLIIVVGVIVFMVYRSVIFICFSLAIFWAVFDANQYINNIDSIPINSSNTIIDVSISTLFNENIPTEYFEVKVLNLHSPNVDFVLPLRLMVFWKDAPRLKQGQIWRLPVRLSRIVGRVNQAGFDRERYALSRSIHGRAVVINANGLPTRLSSSISFRQQWLDNVTPLLKNTRHQSYLTALTFGLREGLEAQDWIDLRDSGLAHLLAISGLHIGLAMLIGWWIGYLLRLCLPQTGYWLWLPLLCGLLFAFGYAWLAGFSLPTIRALLMCLIVGVLRITAINWRPWQILLVTLGLCLSWDPFVSYSAGFWLSFGAVIIFLIMFIIENSPTMTTLSWQQRWYQRIKSLFKVQGYLLLLMLPIQWWWFGGVSLAAPLTNLIAVPWLSFITVPLVLIGVITVGWPWLSSLFWLLADFSLTPILNVAAWSNGAWMMLSASITPLLVMIAVMIVVWPLLPLKYFRWFYVSIIFIACSGWWENRKSDQSQWTMKILDVGHGLAILIEKQQRVFIYDTGNAWEGKSIAQSIIEPILAYKGISAVDGLVLSHSDNDHAGGSDYLIQRYQPLEKYSSDQRDGFLACVMGQKWQWQGLEFSVKWPPATTDRATNSDSCVIHIQPVDGSGPSVLLTGDIDAKSELVMLTQVQDWQADIIVVPHHGSSTSSTQTLLDAVKPSLAVVSIGHFNPWGLPSMMIKKRYQANNVNWISTQDSGQVSIIMSPNNYSVKQQRYHYSQAWYRPQWLAKE